MDRTASLTILGTAMTASYIAYVTVTHGDGYVLGTVLAALGGLAGYLYARTRSEKK